jgi:hypothetical protein
MVPRRWSRPEMITIALAIVAVLIPILIFYFLHLD